MPIYRGIKGEKMYEVWQSMNSCGGPRININHKICQPILGASCWCLENLGPKRRSLHLLWRIRKELRSAGFFHDVRPGLSLRHLLFKTHWNVETGWKAIRNLQKSFGKSRKCAPLANNMVHVKHGTMFLAATAGPEKKSANLGKLIPKFWGPQKSIVFFFEL